MVLKLRTVIINLHIIIGFVLRRSFGNIIYDIAQKYSLDVEDDQLQIKANKAKLNVNFLKNCESFQVCPRFFYYRYWVQVALKSMRFAKKKVVCWNTKKNITNL